jgi:SnoaL-like domain
MSPAIEGVAHAFSTHRLENVGEALADAVEWNLVGAEPIVGRDAVLDAYTAMTTELADTETTFTELRSVSDGVSVVIDGVGKYVDGEGVTSVVASCDIYEFTGQRISRITSYNIELPAE